MRIQSKDSAVADTALVLTLTVAGQVCGVPVLSVLPKADSKGPRRLVGNAAIASRAANRVQSSKSCARVNVSSYPPAASTASRLSIIEPWQNSFSIRSRQRASRGRPGQKGSRCGPMNRPGAAGRGVQVLMVLQ
jgi:hypothetical protein